MNLVDHVVNLDFVYDECAAANQDYSTTFVNCNIVDVIDLSTYTTGVNDDVQITLAITSDVIFLSIQEYNILSLA